LAEFVPLIQTIADGLAERALRRHARCQVIEPLFEGAQDRRRLTLADPIGLLQRPDLTGPFRRFAPRFDLILDVEEFADEVAYRHAREARSALRAAHFQRPV